jgi:hypothetical protein
VSLTGFGLAVALAGSIAAIIYGFSRAAIKHRDRLGR